jgi:hypothetical protein
MTTREIATELNKNKWYQKKNGSAIDPFQIHGRTKNYPQLFDRNGTTVSLHGKQQVNALQPVILPVEKKVSLSGDIANNELLEKILMNEKNFKSASAIDQIVPDRPGLYCIRIRDIGKLPEPFDQFLRNRNHNIMYIGIASQSLSKRFLNQELRARGHGTFFRSIGAVLGYRPEKGSLLSMANHRNYTFPPASEKKIIEWINNNLLVNWVTCNGDIDVLETNFIQRYLPLMNLSKNPILLDELKDLRSECVKIANS